MSMYCVFNHVKALCRNGFFHNLLVRGERGENWVDNNQKTLYDVNYKRNIKIHAQCFGKTM